MRLNLVNQSKSLVNEQNHKAIAAFLYYLKNKAFLKGKKPSECTIDAYLSTLSLFFQDVQKPYTDVTTEEPNRLKVLVDTSPQGYTCLLRNCLSL